MTTTDTRPCGDCAVTVGTPHRRGCDVARCLWTGRQRIQCDGHHPDLAGAPCGLDVWTGLWPGDAECREFGWWVQDRSAEGLGFTPCGPDAPGAMEDLNRLHRDAVWDRAAAQWRKREAAR